MQKGLVFSALMFLTVPHSVVEAAECRLNIEKAHRVAVKHGWNFECLSGVIDWNKSKKIGCRMRTPPFPGPSSMAVWARFFIYNSEQDTTESGRLKSGWTIKSFTVSGGQYTKIDPGTDARLQFRFVPGGRRNTVYRRHLNEVVVEHPIRNKSCKNVYNEAFR